MKTKDVLLRYVSVLGRLSNGRRASYSELVSHVISVGGGEDFKFSQRTLQRLIHDVESLFRIKISCDTEGKYYIVQDDMDDMSLRLFENLQNIHYQKHFDQYQKFISYDRSCSLGQNFLYDIKSAISSKVCLNIIYKKFGSNSEMRMIGPYGIKEHEGRWYVTALDKSIDEIRTFAVDRIERIEYSNTRYTIPGNFDIEEYYQNSIGVYLSEDDIPEIVVLKFSNKLLSYIENFPLHASQKIETLQDETFVRLKVIINIDLVNLLMKYSDDVKVLKPKSLKNMMKNRAEIILKNNN